MSVLLCATHCENVTVCATLCASADARSCAHERASVLLCASLVKGDALVTVTHWCSSACSLQPTGATGHGDTHCAAGQGDTLVLLAAATHRCSR